MISSNSTSSRRSSAILTLPDHSTRARTHPHVRDRRAPGARSGFSRMPSRMRGSRSKESTSSRLPCSRSSRACPRSSPEAPHWRTHEKTSVLTLSFDERLYPCSQPLDRWRIHRECCAPGPPRPFALQWRGHGPARSPSYSRSKDLSTITRASTARLTASRLVLLPSTSRHGAARTGLVRGPCGRCKSRASSSSAISSSRIRPPASIQAALADPGGLRLLG